MYTTPATHSVRGTGPGREYGSRDLVRNRSITELQYSSDRRYRHEAARERAEALRSPHSALSDTVCLHYRFILQYPIHYRFILQYPTTHQLTLQTTVSPHLSITHPTVGRLSSDQRSTYGIAPPPQLHTQLLHYSFRLVT